MRRHVTIGLMLVGLLAAPAAAQWLNVPQASTPRTPDGKPNLAAPTPRLPDGTIDLSGIWIRQRGVPPSSGGRDGIAAGVEVFFQPAGEALYKARADTAGKGTPSEQCLPHGITKAVSVPEPFKILQMPGLIVILLEEFNHHRQVFMDGRAVPARRTPTYFGYSRGRWDGDTLVIDTTGFRDGQWLDFRGHPATETLHLTERYRRRDFGHLDIQFTVDDPKVYAKPWTTTLAFDLLPDTELIEHFCENERDTTLELLVGK
jgi:hypothetical protein